MVGALNKLPIAIAGMIFFEGAFTIGAATGVFIGNYNNYNYFIIILIIITITLFCSIYGRIIVFTC